jgi:hypothetical protein
MGDRLAGAKFDGKDRFDAAMKNIKLDNSVFFLNECILLGQFKR